MQFIEWTQRMSVGSDVLDGHHRMIIDCLNRLYPLIGEDGREEEVHAVLAKLEEFVLLHFSEEEQCMKKIGYPDWRSHKEQHDKMYDIVFGMKSDVEHGRALDAKNLFDIIYNWLIQHIMGEDKKYESYLKNPSPEPNVLWTRSNGRPY
ncbi:bacteriohemerythrin [Telmatospirillum sp.]|uniref:bacteriohemerythrin n=1 Tax=Telmatospirillum sp. TaxID=2079197 RepID=UPI002848FC3B|nr:bacteriohemerythrin [Telmatospirillum sp.]MDR3435241.1 bacteriohemerythrin [Telmatospirillum sp.]